ncbi:MAG TPA: MATE family efflux transporter [bacterium]|nr:MATE family efflux transporter [bacterium]
MFKARTARLDITGGPVRETLLRLALPVIVLNILKAGYNIVDMFWIGRLGADYLAGVSGSVFLVWAIHGLSHLITTGITAGVSRNAGEGREDLAAMNAGRSLLHTVWVGLLITLLVYPLAPLLIRYVGMSAVATVAGIQYLEVMAAFTVVIFLMFSLHSIMIARGDTVMPVRVYGATFVLNIVLSPVLMFGIGPFPRLETRGAAYATIVSYLVACLWFWWLMRRRGWVSFRGAGLPGIIPLRRYISLGYPIALTGMMFSFIYFFIANVTARFGDAAVGAMGIGHRVESIAYFFSFGLATGLSSFVGQNIGAGRPERAVEATRHALRVVALLSLFYTVFTMVTAPFLVSLFNDEPGLVAFGVAYIYIVMPAEVLQSLLIVIEDGAFTGAGYTRPSFTVSLPITLARIPLAWFLAVFCGFGAGGIWATIALTMALNAFFFLALYRRDDWLKVKIVS